MAALFLILAVLVGVVVGDALVANTGSGTMTIFDQTITGFSQGELYIIFAGLGFVVALLLCFAWGGSRSRRMKRRELRTARRDLEGRIIELEHDNAGLRRELASAERTQPVAIREGPERPMMPRVAETLSPRPDELRHDSVEGPGRTASGPAMTERPADTRSTRPGDEGERVVPVRSRASSPDSADVERR